MYMYSSWKYDEIQEQLHVGAIGTCTMYSAYVNLEKITNVQSTVAKKTVRKWEFLKLEYSYSKYCNLIGQLQCTIFCSALVWPGQYFDSAHVLQGSGLHNVATCTCNLLILIMFSFSCVI